MPEDLNVTVGGPVTAIANAIAEISKTTGKAIDFIQSEQGREYIAAIRQNQEQVQKFIEVAAKPIVALVDRIKNRTS